MNVAQPDNHLLVEFYSDAVHSKRLSEEEGRPVYIDREMVRIRWPGDTTRELDAPAQELFRLASKNGEHVTYAEAYPAQYAAFKSKASAKETGTPLGLVPFLKPVQIRELEHSHVYTAEQLAALPDGIVRKMGPQQAQVVQQTREWLAATRDAATSAAVAAENQDLKSRLAKLEAALSKMEPASAAPEVDGIDGWTDEQLRAHLTDAGAPPRANAARASMISAVKEMMAE